MPALVLNPQIKTAAPIGPRTEAESLRVVQAYHFAIADVMDQVERADVTSGKFPKLTVMLAYMAHVIGLASVQSIARYLTASESQVVNMVSTGKLSGRNGPRDGDSWRGLVTAEEAKAIRNQAQRHLRAVVSL